MRAAGDHDDHPSRREWTRVATRYLMPIVAAIVAACILMGCAHDVTMLNPRTGEMTTCRASALNPWSQQEACVGEHIAQGWRRFE